MECNVATWMTRVNIYIRRRVKLDYFSYSKGKIVHGVSLGCPVVQDGYLKGKIGSLPNFKSDLIFRNGGNIMKEEGIGKFQL